MSYKLNGKGTSPGLEIKTHGILFGGNDLVILSGRKFILEISVEDFLFAAHYVLTNTDLRKNDPRIQFVRCIKKMKRVSGWNENNRRFKSPINPTN